MISSIAKEYILNDIDSEHYSIRSEIFDEFHDSKSLSNTTPNAKNCIVKEFSSKNDFIINAYNPNLETCSFSYEIQIKIDNTLYNTSHNNAILTIFNQTFTKVISINDENTYFKEEDDMIYIKMNQQSILSKQDKNFSLINSINNYKNDENLQVIISNHSFLRVNDIDVVKIEGYVRNLRNSDKMIELHYWRASNNKNENVFNSQYISINPANEFSHFIPIENKFKGSSFYFQCLDNFNRIYSNKTLYTFTYPKVSTITRKLQSSGFYSMSLRYPFKIPYGTKYIPIKANVSVPLEDLPFIGREIIFYSKDTSPQEKVFFYNESCVEELRYSGNVSISDCDFGFYSIYILLISDGENIMDLNPEYELAIPKFPFEILRPVRILSNSTTSNIFVNGDDTKIPLKVTFYYNANESFLFNYTIGSLPYQSLNITLSEEVQEKKLLIDIPDLSKGTHYLKIKDDIDEFSLPFIMIEGCPPEIQYTETTQENTNKHIKGINDSIAINFSYRDLDGIGKIYFNYYFVLFQTISTFVTDLLNTDWIPYSNTINIQGLTVSNSEVHSLSIFLSDDFGYKSNVIKYYFKYVQNHPILSLIENQKTSYTYQIDQLIELQYQYSDPREDGPIKLLSSIDCECNYNIYTVFQLISNHASGSESFDLDLFSGETIHTIRLKAKNSFDEESNVVMFQFTFHYSDPIITLYKLPSLSYTRMINKTIIISGAVKDINQGFAWLQYEYDIKNEFTTIKQFNITSSDYYTFSQSIPIDCSLSEGKHNITFKIIDSFNKSFELVPYSFNYQYHCPDIQFIDSIDESNTPIYFRSFYDTIKIPIFVTYYSEVDYLDICYTIKNEDFSKTTRLDMNKETSKVAKIQFEIPNQYDEKTYTVIISATDQSNSKTSNEIFYLFDYSYSNPYHYNRIALSIPCRTPIHVSTYLTQFVISVLK